MIPSPAAQGAIAQADRLRPPGPRGRFLLGCLPDFARDILGFLTACVRDHRDFVRFHIPGYEVFLLHRPEEIDTVLLSQRSNFVKHSFFWRHVTAIFGNALLTSDRIRTIRAPPREVRAAFGVPPRDGPDPSPSFFRRFGGLESGRSPRHGPKRPR